MSQENVEIVLRIQEAVARGDVDGFLAEVHPDGEYRAAIQQAMEGDDGVIRGHEGLRRWLGDLHDLYEELETQVLEVRDVGDQVVIAFVVRVGAEAAASPLSSRSLRWSPWRTARPSTCATISAPTKPSKPWGCGSRRCRRRTWRSCARRRAARGTGGSAPESQCAGRA